MESTRYPATSQANFPCVRTTTHRTAQRSVLGAWLALSFLCTSTLLTLPSSAETRQYSTTYASATAEDNHVLRIDVPLAQEDFRGGELRLGSIIEDRTYIETDDFYLRAIELEATTRRDGEVRLKVGRYVTPAVALPSADEDLGAMRINAPHRSNKAWRLVLDDQVSIYRLTAILEPREDDLVYYESTYRERYGYDFYPDFYPRHDYRYSTRDRYRYNSRYRNTNDFWFWLAPAPSYYRLYPTPRARAGDRRRDENRKRDRRRDAETDVPSFADSPLDRPRNRRNPLPPPRGRIANGTQTQPTAVAPPRTVRSLSTRSPAQAARHAAAASQRRAQQTRDSVAAQQLLRQQQRAQQRQRQVQSPQRRTQATQRRAPQTQRRVQAPQRTTRQAAAARQRTMGPVRRSEGGRAGASPRRVAPVQQR